MAAGKYVCYVRAGRKKNKMMLQGYREGTPVMQPYSGPDFDSANGALVGAIYLLLLRDKKQHRLYFEGGIKGRADDHSQAFREKYDSEEFREDGLALLHEAEELIAAFKAGLEAAYKAHVAHST